MRVAFLSTYPPIHCGVGEYTRFLARSIVDSEPGVEVVVLAEKGVGAKYEDDTIPVIPSFSKRNTQSVDKAMEILESMGGADILHVQHEYGIFGCDEELLDNLEAWKRKGVFKRIVFTLHTVYHPRTGGRETRFQEKIIDSSDAVVVHSPIQEFELVAQYGAYPGNLYRIPHGTMLNPYYSEPRLSLASRLGLEPSRIHGKTVLAVPGFLRMDKGLDVLLEALENLDVGSLIVVVAGEVVHKELLEIVERAEEAGKLILIPRYLSSSEILMLAALSDVIVLPYKDPPGKYAVSGILHLSMGSMKPIIGTNVPRLSELYTLTPRLVVRSGDYQALAQAIERFSSKEFLDLIIPYAGSLYSYAVRTSWPRTARRHVSLYKRLLLKH